MTKKKLHELCATFPPLPDREVPRDQHLETFMSVFSGPVELLVLEGGEGTGKTTLLSQFTRQFPDRVISSFVTPTQRYSYDPFSLQQDYSAQILSILDPKRSFSPKDARDGVVQRLMHTLRRRHGKNTYFFVLDGLTEIPDEVLKGELASILPIGLGFPVIVSGELRQLPSVLRNNRQLKTTQAVNFSLAEVHEYFADLNTDDSETRQIYLEFGKGVPGKLASIRRSLLAGLDLDQLRGKDTKELFEQEWQYVITDEMDEMIVALVAHSRHRLGVNSLATILDLDSKAVSARLEKIRFLQLDRTGSYVGFVSRSVADLAAGMVVETKGMVIDMLVTHIWKEERKEHSSVTDTVPGYLQEVGRLEELMSLLSADFFRNALEKSQSFAPIRKQLQIGIESAIEQGHDSELMRFCLERSLIMEIESAQVSRYEIEALMTTGRVSEAVSLADRCALREDRLHLLAVIARCGKERGSPVGEDTLDQIRQLHNQIDPKSLGSRGIDIAAELFPCLPDLAVSLIEQGSPADGDENELDMAYVRLSIATAARQTASAADGDDLETIRNRIRDPRLRGFTSVFTSRVESAAEVVAEAERLEAASDRLYMLRKWATENSARDDATEVAEYGLKTIVEATGYGPNLRVLRELSTPLLHTKDRATAQSLVRIFDGQRRTVEDQGPTEEAVRLQLNLAVAESLYDEKACANRLVEVYLSVDELGDLSTKASCLARLLATLQTVDRCGEIDKKEQLISLSSSELDKAIAELLEHTGEQLDVTRRTIRSLASFDGRRSINLAKSLNTASRREEALLLAIDAILECEMVRVDLKSIRSAYDDLQRSESKDRVAASVAEYLARLGSIGETSAIRSGVELFQDVFFCVTDLIMRCRVLCLLHGLAHKGLYSTSDAAPGEISERIDKALEDIEPGWRRIDTSLRVARSLADWDPNLAQRHLNEAKEERERTVFGSFSSEWAYEACLRLSIRAFAGQLGEGYDPREDLSRLGRLIDRLPSTSLRAELWGELAMKLFLKKHTDDGNRVVTEQLVPLIDTMGDESVKSNTIAAVAPALYCSHKNTAFSKFDSLEEHHRDDALMACAKFILERHVPSDPYEAHDAGYDIKYQEAVDIVELAGKIRRDNLVYGLIAAISDTLSSSRFSKGFTVQQKADLVREMESLIDKKFPDKNNIQHDGYAVASEAQLLRFERKTRLPWAEIPKRAESIRNRSDRAFVLGIVGHIIPSKEANRRESVFQDAMQDTETIPCIYDRISRLNDLADMMARKSSRLARRCLSMAVEGLSGAEGGPVSRVFRNVVDTAFKFDPEFAASLVSIADNDPARLLARHEMRRRLETLNTKKAIVDSPGSGDQFGEDKQDLPLSSWLALGSLNAGRAHPIRLAQLRAAVRAAGRYPLREAFPILSWVIENAQRFSGAFEARSAVRVLFEAGMQATELAEIAASTASISVRQGLSSVISSVSDESIVVRRGERERAVEFIRNWLEISAPEHVYICDQYFGASELDLVMLVQSVIPSVEVIVLTSLRHQKNNNYLPIHETYRPEWQRISAQEPPKVEIIAIGFEDSEKSPIHDRSILTESGGISMGTSWNSIGLTQDSTVSVLSDVEVSQLSERLGQYLFDRRRDYRGKRLRYVSDTL